MNEKEIIRRFFTRQLNDQAVQVGIGDDGAVVSPPENHELVITTDAMVQDSHFTKETSPYDLGYKLLAVNLSDVAAMGAEPKWATLNITLPTIDMTWLQQFSQGLFECADQYQVALIGGDLCKGTQTHVAIQLIGIVPTGQALTRAGAQVGESVFVTGSIGTAAHAIGELYLHDHDQSCLSATQYQALYRPVPRVEIGIGLRKLASCAIDISDGLLHELQILCTASAVGVSLLLENIPVANNVDVEVALTGGEDYELLFTTKSDHIGAINQLALIHGCDIANIGAITAGDSIEMLQDGRVLPPLQFSGFDHFQGSEND